MKSFFIFHNGQSMSPMLQHKDMLEAVYDEHIKVGDIVLFENISDEKLIAHRVIGMVDGYVTKGDNNHKVDDDVLESTVIKGIVVARWRHGRRLRIYRGRLGILQSRGYRFYRSLRSRVGGFVGRIALPAPMRRPIEKLLPPPTEALFVKNGEPRRDLYLGRIHIGTYSPRHGRWMIRFPWRLLYGETRDMESG